MNIPPKDVKADFQRKPGTRETLMFIAAGYNHFYKDRKEKFVQSLRDGSAIMA